MSRNSIATQATTRSHALRETSTRLMAEIAFGDSLFGSTDELNASIEREARRARWERRKARGEAN